MDCIFCKIAKGEIPSNKIYENEKVFAFLDISPVNKGHTLIIPKEHYEDVFDTPENIVKECHAAAKKIANATIKATKAKGINITQNNKKAAGQAVFHYHIHVIPRVEEDGLRLWPGGKYEDGEAKKIAETIKKSI